MIRIRTELNAKAAERLKRFITVELGLSIRAFARIMEIPDPTLRYFLGNSSAADATPRHGRGPYKTTLMPILKLQSLPPDLREMLLDVIEFESRLAARLLQTAAQTPAQVGR